MRGLQEVPAGCKIRGTLLSGVINGLRYLAGRCTNQYPVSHRIDYRGKIKSRSCP